MYSVLFLLNFVVIVCPAAVPGYEVGSQGAQYWKDRATDQLAEQLLRVNGIKKVPKNIIFFIGDGMGISTATAARFLKSENKKQDYRQANMMWDEFEHSAMIKTYGTDYQVVDSAASATAYHTGVKTENTRIGVPEGGDPTCEDLSTRLESIGIWAHKAGKHVGIVTTASVTHASPAPLYANSHSRRNEGDIKDKDQQDVAACQGRDHASQLVEGALQPEVVLGGGKKYFVSSGRKDARNLTEKWEETQRNNSKSARLLLTAAELQEELKNGLKNDKYLGLFAEKMMSYSVKKPDSEPTLQEMTSFAIEALRRNDKGFYLFVEGALIDWAHHSNNAQLSLMATVEMDEAVKIALDKMGPGEDTLIVVSADHSHAFTQSGYLKQGQDIFGVIKPNKSYYGEEARDYTSFNYANGPGAAKKKLIKENQRVEPQEKDAEKPEFVNQALVYLKYSAHAGEDVGLWATGPGSELFSGVKEQNYIPLAMACAAQLELDKAPPQCTHSVTVDASSATPALHSRLQMLISLSSLLSLLLF